MNTSSFAGSHSGASRSGFVPWPIPLQLTVLLALNVAVFSGPFLSLVEMREENVYAHVRFAELIPQTRILYPGHFLFHLLTVATQGVLHVSWLQANVLVMVAARCLLAVIVWALVRRSLQSRDSAYDAALTMVMTMGILLASAVSFLTWGQGNYYLGYIMPNIYVSQTLVVLQPLALLLFFVVLRVIGARPSDVSPGIVIAMAVLALLSTLAKPSYAMVLLPALAILLLLQRRVVQFIPIRQVGLLIVISGVLKSPRAILSLALGLVLPIVIAMGWIYASTYTVVQNTDVSQGSGISIEPFKVMAYFQAIYVPHAQIPVWLLGKFLLSILFPVMVAVTCFSSVRADPRFCLAWLQFAIGAIFMYFFTEEPMFNAGNFTWSAQISLSILFVVSALILIEQTLASAHAPGDFRVSRWRSSAVPLCFAAFALHVIAGVGLYLHPAVS